MAQNDRICQVLLTKAGNVWDASPTPCCCVDGGLLYLPHVEGRCGCGKVVEAVEVGLPFLTHGEVGSVQEGNTIQLNGSQMLTMTDNTWGLSIRE